MRAEHLTAIAGKSALYERDVWFSLGLRSVAERLPAIDLWRLATITAKPEAIYARKLGPILDYLAGNGFAVVATRRVRFDQGSVHEMWKYHWRAATEGRRALAEDLLSVGESLFIAVADVTDLPAVPASVRLAALKGPTLPAGRLPGQLRSQLGIQRRMLNFVHTPDDPADVVREFGLLFSDRERSGLLGAIEDGDRAHDSALEMVRALYAQYPERSLEEEAAYLATVQSLEQARGIAAAEPRTAAEEALSILAADRARPGALPWLELRPRMLAARPDLDLWNPLVYASERIAHDQQGTKPDLPDGTEADWRVLGRVAIF